MREIEQRIFFLFGEITLPLCFFLQGETALHVACERGLVNLITRLLECGANPNIPTLPPESIGVAEEVVSSSYRLTPIQTAILNRQEEAVRAMLEYSGMISYVSIYLLKSCAKLRY